MILEKYKVENPKKAHRYIDTRFSKRAIVANYTQISSTYFILSTPVKFDCTLFLSIIWLYLSTQWVTTYFLTDTKTIKKNYTHQYSGIAETFTNAVVSNHNNRSRVFFCSMVIVKQTTAKYNCVQFHHFHTEANE